MFSDYGNSNLRVRVLKGSIIFQQIFNRKRNLHEQVPFFLISLIFLARSINVISGSIHVQNGKTTKIMVW